MDVFPRNAILSIDSTQLRFRFRCSMLAMVNNFRGLEILKSSANFILHRQTEYNGANGVDRASEN